MIEDTVSQLITTPFPWFLFVTNFFNKLNLLFDILRIEIWENQSLLYKVLRMIEESLCEELDSLFCLL